ncbi:MAG: hypothetical protein IPM95_00735 [Sphingobacteriales bacterium]|nr:hypothetical protein [Sphingobacteriales bacterium]
MNALLVTFFSFLFTAGLYAQNVFTTEWIQLIPSAAMPTNIKCRNSNNNLDIVLFSGRYYVAFRTAPTHFASKKTTLYIISSTDFKTWVYENSYSVGADMREPRFVVFKDRLFFYFFEGGTRLFKFEPKHIWVSILSDNGWSEKQKTNMDGFVNWRFRVQSGKLYLSAYYGVNLYTNEHQANLRLFTSENGIYFTPISEQAQIATQGAEEGEFIFDHSGNLWATVRLEGSGSYLCYASKDSIDRWKVKFSKLKYDSALLFEYGDAIYLISRRHLKGDATKVEIPDDKQRMQNLIRYSFSKKVTALFRINKEKMEIEHIIDFPSTGDTAFPGIAPRDENSFYLLNYSSDIHKRDKIWIGGQLGKTYIYQTVLHFSK